MNTTTALCSTGVLLALSALPGSAAARSDETFEFDGIEVRCSTINSATLPEASLERYDIDGSRDRGVLSCMVYRTSGDGPPENIRASVEAAHHSIGETPRPLPMRATEANDLVTYVGTYPVESQYPIQFSIDVDVAGQPPVSMDMRDLQPRS
jgi:hypothetical protein